MPRSAHRPVKKYMDALASPGMIITAAALTHALAALKIFEQSDISLRFQIPMLSFAASALAMAAASACMVYLAHLLIQIGEHNGRRRLRSKISHSLEQGMGRA